MTEALEIQDTPVYSYPIASADMRYIEIGERDIFLRDDPDADFVFRGEISGCGADYYVGLNEILLEYAMSCEGCREQSVASKEVIRFGAYLGEILALKLYPDIADLPTTEKLSHAFKCVLTSMSAKYVAESKEHRLEYSLDCCPLSECAKDTGLGRSFEMAHLSFTALCKSVINALAPDWVLMEPTKENNIIPIHKIVIAGLQVL
jgi:hypothetical protein